MKKQVFGKVTVFNVSWQWDHNNNYIINYGHSHNLHYYPSLRREILSMDE